MRLPQELHGGTLYATFLFAQLAEYRHNILLDGGLADADGVFDRLGVGAAVRLNQNSVDAHNN